MTATQQPAPSISPDISVTPTRKPAGRRKPFFVELWQSAVGKKWIMAVSGVVLMLFVLGHAVGNLKMYLGEEAFNHYSDFLRQILVPILPPTVFLWIVRIGIIAAFVFHIWAAASLTAMNRKANKPYVSRRDYLAANFAARTMRWTGIIIALFLIWHLADLTLGVHPIAPSEWARGAAFQNVVDSLQRGGVALLYVIANVALGIHLFHASWSLFQSLGLNNPRFNRARRVFATCFAIVVAGINISFPIMIQAGVVGG
ncbi:MAG: succinate dehydrogenase cytochrome b subunit [Actinomycetes bacterium]